jgi:hypothetical protein
MITGVTKHFTFHIRWISIGYLRFSHFNSFLASFCITFLSDDTVTSTNKHIITVLLLLIIIIIRITVNFAEHLLLNQWWTPPWLQLSDCEPITFHTMCDIPSTALFVEKILNASLEVSRYFSPLGIITVPSIVLLLSLSLSLSLPLLYYYYYLCNYDLILNSLLFILLLLHYYWWWW